MIRIALSVLLIAVVGIAIWLFIQPKGVVVIDEVVTQVPAEKSSVLGEIQDANVAQDTQEINERAALTKNETDTVAIKGKVSWPVPGSAPETNVQHSVPLEEIKQGCFRQDCIPSVDSPTFVNPTSLNGVLDPESIGIALSYKGVERFYPFPMLETHELVNDFVAGDALLISYCPLCGTGIVFDRTLDGVVVEFGVSGMLWQSNLLMYNRADALADRNLWSQVLGKAVVGDRVNQQLTIVPSDIQKYGAWAAAHSDGAVLITGTPADPYDGNYYDVASRFGPNFDSATSEIEPMAYVYGIEHNGIHKAYQQELLPVGTITDTLNGATLTIVNDGQTVQFLDTDGDVISDVEGFWFSWKAAHPDTLVWKSN